MTYSDTALKALFLSDPAAMRRVIITNNQIHILNIIKNYAYPSMSARELSVIKNLSIQSASQYLSKLCAKGYLLREEITDPTGGILYRYKFAL